MDATYKLNGYDAATERLTETHEIPNAAMPKALHIAHAVPHEDMPASFALEPGQARDIAKAIGVPLNVSGRGFFLERVAEPHREATVDVPGSPGSPSFYWPHFFRRSR
jgi:hypothetical protein